MVRRKKSSKRQFCGWKFIFDERSRRRRTRPVRGDRNETVAPITSP